MTFGIASSIKLTNKSANESTRRFFEPLKLFICEVELRKHTYLFFSFLVSTDFPNSEKMSEKWYHLKIPLTVI
jgi:hypothetical protein